MLIQDHRRVIAFGVTLGLSVLAQGASQQSPLEITDSAATTKFALEYLVETASPATPLAAFSLENRGMQWRWQHPDQLQPQNWQIQMTLDVDSKLRLHKQSTTSGGDIILDPSIPRITIAGETVLTEVAANGKYAPYTLGMIQLNGSGPQKISMKDSTTTQDGNSLQIAAGGSRLYVPHETGGELILSSGASRGYGGSMISFQTATPSVAGQRNNPVTHMRLSGNGGLGLGSGAFTGQSWGSYKELDISWGGIPATMVIGADMNLTTRTNNTVKHASIAVPQYNTSNKPFGAFTVVTDNGVNSVTVGGGLHNPAATHVSIATAVNANTAGGTSRMRFHSGGGIEMGTGAVSINDTSGFAIGLNANNSSYDGAAIGRNSKAAGHGSIAVGAYAEAHQGFSVALGWETDVNQPYSNAIGLNSKANAQQSTALGIATDARGYGQTVVGVANAAIASENAATYNDPNSEVFVVGSGTHQPASGVWVTTRANALTVKRNGNTWVKGDLKVDGVLRVAAPAGDIGMGAFTAAQ